MNLRPYQNDCIRSVVAGYKQFRRQLAVLPTGAGKTIIFSHLAALLQPARTLILAHREELIEQAIDKLHAATGIRAEKEKAESSASTSAQVVVASVQTMIRRLARWPVNHFGLVVADEAHHAISDSWQTVLRHFEHANVLGVTATPDRGDKRNLGTYFENVAFEITLFDLIHQGYLSPISIHAVPLQIDLSKVRSLAGDFNDADLGHAIEPYLGEIARAIKEAAGSRRTLVFLPLIATSRKFAEECNAVGLSAAHIDGQSPDRAQILERFAEWDFQVLSNAMLLTEGYDDPGIDCVVVLRPTRSRPLYAQMIGRGTRVAALKDNLLLLDFLWMHEKHRICRPANLIAKSDEEADVITERAQQAVVPGDVAADFPDLEALATSAQSERENALRKKLEENRKKKGKVISAEEFALTHNIIAIADYEPVMPWEAQPVSEKQAWHLKRAGLDLETVRGKGHASKILDVIFREQKVKLASEAQRVTMRKMGHPNAQFATAWEARQFFAGLNRRKE